MEKEFIYKYGRIAANDAEKHGFNNGEDLYVLLTKAACECAEVVKAKEEGRIGNRQAFEMAVGYLKGQSMSQRVFDSAFFQQYNDKCKDTLQDEIADVAIFLMQAIVLFDIEGMDGECDNLIDYDSTHKKFYEVAGNIMCFILAPSGFNGRIYSAINVLEEWMKKEQNEDLRWWVESKIKYNKLRPYRHGIKQI